MCNLDNVTVYSTANYVKLKSYYIRSRLVYLLGFGSNACLFTNSQITKLSTRWHYRIVINI